MSKIKIQNIVIGAFLVFILCAPQALAQLNTIENLEDYGLPAGTLSDLLARILEWVTASIGIVALVVLVWGGVRYMTAGGNEERAAQAKKFMTYAVVGVAFSIGSLIVIRFIADILKETPTQAPPHL